MSREKLRTTKARRRQGAKWGALLVMGLLAVGAMGQKSVDRTKAMKTLIAEMDRMIQKAEIPDTWWDPNCKIEDAVLKREYVEEDEHRQRLNRSRILGDCDVAKEAGDKCGETLKAAQVFGQLAWGTFTVINLWEYDEETFVMRGSAKGRRLDGSDNYLSSIERLQLGRAQADSEKARRSDEMLRRDNERAQRLGSNERAQKADARASDVWRALNARVERYERVDGEFLIGADVVRAFGAERLAKATKIEAVVMLDWIRVSCPWSDPQIKPVVCGMHGRITEIRGGPKPEQQSQTKP